MSIKSHKYYVTESLVDVAMRHIERLGRLPQQHAHIKPPGLDGSETSSKRIMLTEVDGGGRVTHLYRNRVESVPV